MSELRPEDRALFDAGRTGLEPDDEARRRIERSLALQLGAGSGLAHQAAAGSAKGAGGASAILRAGVTWKWGAALLVGLGLAASTVAVVHRPTPSARTPASVAVTVPPSPSPTASRGPQAFVQRAIL